MSAEAHERLVEASEKVVADLDKRYFRRMQADMHRCCAKCCDDTVSSMDRVQNCIERCQEPVARAQADFQNQFKEAQDRLNRCIMQCNDEVKEQADHSSNPDMSAYTRNFEACATNCVDKFVSKGIPSLVKRVEEAISRGKF